MKVRLGDICEINMGQSPNSSSYNYEQYGLPFFQGNADFGLEHPLARVWCDSPKKIADPDDILISVRAPIGALNIANKKCCIGRGLAAIKVSQNCNKRYIWYALSGKINELKAQGTGSTFKAINKETLSKTEFSLPSLDVQQHVSKILDLLCQIVNLRKEQIYKLDELVKSRFMEMFGDPWNDSNKYPLERLSNLSEKITDGVHKKPTYTQSGRPFLSVVNINKRVVDFSNCKFISNNDFDLIAKSNIANKGDILYTKVGATYGIAAHVETDIKFALYVSVCLIKPKHNIINSCFLAHSMNMPYVKYQADRRVKGIGVPDLHLNQIREFSIIVPPLPLQQQFAAFVEKVDKSKLAVKQSLEKLETLKKSLMQQYFG